MSAATESVAPAHQREGEHIQPTANGHNSTANTTVNTTATTTEQAAEDGPQDNTNSATRNDAVAAAAAALESTPDPAERDVSNILAGLNQEQLASIVAAARASEARNGAGSTENPSENTLNGETNLGQAASALTSIASGFKRTPGKDAPTAGATSSQTSTEFNGDTKDLDPATTAAITAAKTATGTATAAAIASLAAASHTQQSQSTTSPHQQEPDESLDYSNPNSPGGSRKRPRGPELDRQRKDNHKEVERRRRSAINEGITQLSHIVPGCDTKKTNKGAIIHAAVRYIQDLKHNEANNIEKWTLEKLLMDQAMGDLSQQLEEARAQVERLRAELDERFASEHQQDANGKGQAGES